MNKPYLQRESGDAGTAQAQKTLGKSCRRVN